MGTSVSEDVAMQPTYGSASITASARSSMKAGLVLSAGTLGGRGGGQSRRVGVWGAGQDRLLRCP
jgi:hypothetical protein